MVVKGPAVCQSTIPPAGLGLAPCVPHAPTQKLIYLISNRSACACCQRAEVLRKFKVAGQSQPGRHGPGQGKALGGGTAGCGATGMRTRGCMRAGARAATVPVARTGRSNGRRGGKGRGQWGTLRRSERYKAASARVG